MLKKLLLVAVALFLVGGLIFFIAFAASGFNKNGIATAEIKENTYEEKAGKALTSISVDYTNADIIVSVGEKLTVTYPQLYTKGGNALSKLTVTDVGGTLKINEKIDTLRSIGYDMSKPTVKITIPAERAITLNLETDLGDVTLSGITAEKLLASTENGYITLTDVTSNGIIELETDNGEIDMFGIITATSLDAETANGDISHENGEIRANRIDITTDIGDITATLSGAEVDYTILVEKDLGTSNVKNSVGGDKRATFETDMGDIEIYFTK